MAVVSYYDNVLEVRFPRHARAVALANHNLLMDMEFSEAGRDPRFLPGWYILPAVICGTLMLAALIF